MSQHWIQTYTGKAFDYLNVTPESIDILDIAHALSRIPRFLGHTEQFFSVAQHSVNVSHTVPAGFALEALLHDAPEAYISDLPTPMKTIPALSGPLRALETRIWLAVALKYGTQQNPMLDVLSPEVKKADFEAFVWEHYALRGYCHAPDLERDYGLTELPSWVTVSMACWEPETAKVNFLRRFVELTGDAYAQECLDSLGGATTGTRHSVFVSESPVAWDLLCGRPEK